MCDEIKKEYEFINKIYINKPKKYRLKRILLRLLLGFLLIDACIKLFIEGKSLFRVAGYLGIFLAPLISVLYRLGSRVKPTPASLQIKNEGLLLIYPEIDREDKKGNRGEVYNIPYNNIQKVVLDKSIGCLNIISNPMVVIDYRSNSEEYDFRQMGKSYTNSLYIKEVMCYDLIKNIKDFVEIEEKI